MFFPESRVRVYLYGQPVDMRKSFDGLYAIARAAFTADPTSGDLYVFVNRRGAQIKVLYFDRSGWCVWAKRLEEGQFIGDWRRARTHEIDCTQLKLLLEGIEPQRYRKRYRQSNSEHTCGVAAGACVA
jgi:transposase